MKPATLIKRILIYFSLVLAAFLIDTSVFPLLTFFSAAPNLLLIVVFSYGYIYGSTLGIISGIFAGFLLDVFYGGLFGPYIMIMSYIGFFSGLFADELANDSLIMPMVLALICDIFYNICMLIIKYFNLGTVDIAGSVTGIILPEMFFTLLCTLFIYRILLSLLRAMDMKDEIRGKRVA